MRTPAENHVSAPLVSISRHVRHCRIINGGIRPPWTHGRSDFTSRSGRHRPQMVSGVGLGDCPQAAVDRRSHRRVISRCLTDDRDLWLVFNGDHNHEELRGAHRQRDRLQVAQHILPSAAPPTVLGVKTAFEVERHVCLRDLRAASAPPVRRTRSAGHQAVLLRAAKDGIATRRRSRQSLLPGWCRWSRNSRRCTRRRASVSPMTGFKGISKLPAGRPDVRGRNAHHAAHWQLRPTESPGPPAELVEQLDALLVDSVRLQMRADVPVGVFLGGGLDSSIVSALMRRNTQRDVHSFTIKFTDEDQKFERMTPDDVYAKQVARQFGFVHHEFGSSLRSRMCSKESGISTSRCRIGGDQHVLISQAARDLRIIVLLNGMGATSVRRYRKHLACLTADTIRPSFRGLSGARWNIPATSCRWLRRRGD